MSRKSLTERVLSEVWDALQILNRGFVFPTKIACHEAGHFIVGIKVKYPATVKEVCMNPLSGIEFTDILRSPLSVFNLFSLGGYVGYKLPSKNRPPTPEEIHAKIVTDLAGVAAEELVFGRSLSSWYFAREDIKSALRNAMDLVRLQNPDIKRTELFVKAKEILRKAKREAGEVLVANMEEFTQAVNMLQQEETGKLNPEQIAQFTGLAPETT